VWQEVYVGTAVQVATEHLNAPTTRQMEAEREASGRKLLQTSDATNLRMHADYMLDGVDASFARIIQVSSLDAARHNVLMHQVSH
jgi:hypothetical protein